MLNVQCSMIKVSCIKNDRLSYLVNKSSERISCSIKQSRMIGKKTMKLTKYWLGLCSVVTILPLIPSVTSPVNACSVTAPTHQLAITGTRNGAIQQSEINIGHDDNCLGNTIVAPTNQVSVGADQSVQVNEGNYWVGGGDYNQTGVSSPVIEVTPTIQNEVYSPAYDDNFNPAGRLMNQY